ncbi:MAG: hypothetical protein IPO03_03370 [Bacteroidetes bacterium]|nr:hypothetical protein [Bacteroidota bacterium]
MGSKRRKNAYCYPIGTAKWEKCDGFPFPPGGGLTKPYPITKSSNLSYFYPMSKTFIARHKKFIDAFSNRQWLVKAVDDISPQIFRGETVGIVGLTASVNSATSLP